MNTNYIKTINHKTWAEIIIDRPKKYNALHPNMFLSITEKAKALASQQSIRCIVIRSVGEHFSAGFDVAWKMPHTDTKAMWTANRSVQAAVEELTSLPVVLVCELRGYVVGAGLLLAAVCNLRYAEPDAIFYIPELDMGIPYSLGGVATTARYLGITRTADLVLNCCKIKASDVKMTQFVTEIIESNKLTKYTNSIAERLGKRPNSLIISSISTIREAERALLAPPASDLFTMLYVDQEREAKGVRSAYSKKYRKNV